MPILIIQRTNEYTNRIRNIGVYIDGTKAGEISNGQSKEFTIQPGMHKLYCKIDWCTSPEVQFQINDGQNKKYKVGSFVRGKWYRMFLSIYYILFAKNRYLYLDEV